jgi:LuxR family maltose regulon positive regulatory protein
MAVSGVAVADGAVGRLHQRTEGWAAGLRLAAMSLARQDDPDRFVAEFSGSERTVADYLVGEVLASQPPEVRRLLLRTCILERVNGPLADLLTGGGDGARLLHELEEANALVVAVDVARAWFRYHHLLADLLRLELQRAAPAEVPGLHRLAASWHAEHGNPVEAIRHAQLGQDWDLAAELLGRHWGHLVLDGEEATLSALLGGLPGGMVERDAEVATIAAAGRLAESRWTEADALMAVAERAIPQLPEARRPRAETALATVQLLRARRLGDLDAVGAGAGRMLHADAGADDELVALALMNLGILEGWTRQVEASEEHLQRALALARSVGRQYVEVGCLGGLAVTAVISHRLDRAEDLARQSIAIAERVGWSTQGIVGTSFVTLGAVLVERGFFEEGERWLERAAPIVAVSPEPAAGVGLAHAQGMLALNRGRLSEALAAFREGERITGQLRAPHFLAVVERHWVLRVKLALGDLEPARAALADGADDAFSCNLRGRLRLAEGDAAAAAAAVAPVLTGDAPVWHPNFQIEGLLVDALARTALDEVDAAEGSIERALALAEPQGRVSIFLTFPGARELLEAHPPHRTAHAAHLKTVLDHLTGVEPASVAEAPGELDEPLSDRELAVLRFLPTNLSAGEIGSELFLSVHTVKTHMRKLYAKLDVHTRAEAVQRGRALGLLGPARRGA